jgi:3'-phosphoadenosine 5'-phosphosulfate sulfotransferase (PAPS reductase)/FAD synthetase
LSGGKDSLAMLHVILEAGIEPAANLYYDGGWDFPYMGEHLEQIEHIAGIKITVIRPRINFDYCVRVKKYKWPKFDRRWCTGYKVKALQTITHCFDNPKVAIGIAHEEKQRAWRGTILEDRVPPVFPLLIANLTGSEALAYCMELGYDFCGHYKLFNRLNCYCCPFSRINECKMLYKHFPTLWRNMLEYQFLMGTNIRFSNDVTILSLNAQFRLEEETEHIKLFPHWLRVKSRGENTNL